MRTVAIVLALVALSLAQSYSPACQIILGYGYPCEEHQVLTSDGWWLRLQRIPHGKSGPSATSKGVVFFQHGLTDDSSGCVLNDPTEAFPFIIADAGYDMWLGNNRGNGVSMQNIHYTTSDSAFWDFSWDEMAQIDLPTNIEYILSYTNASTLTYMGHSQGTVQAFSGFVYNHTIASKVNLYVALAPVAFVKNVESVLLVALAKLEVQEIFDLLGVNEFYLPNVIKSILPDYCSLFPSICEFSVNLVCGPTTYFNKSRAAYYLDYEPNPTSVKNMAHWAQGVRDGTFGMYDYGTTGNMQHYNQSVPPQYNLGDFPTFLPTALFTGTEDYLADPKDVATLIATISITPYVHNEPTYAHLDPLLGEQAYTMIYPRILQLIQQYNTQEIPLRLQ